MKEKRHVKKGKKEKKEKKQKREKRDGVDVIRTIKKWGCEWGYLNKEGDETAGAQQQKGKTRGRRNKKSKGDTGRISQHMYALVWNNTAA